MKLLNALLILGHARVPVWTLRNCIIAYSTREIKKQLLHVVFSKTYDDI